MACLIAIGTGNEPALIRSADGHPCGELLGECMLAVPAAAQAHPRTPPLSTRHGLRVGIRQGIPTSILRPKVFRWGFDNVVLGVRHRTVLFQTHAAPTSTSRGTPVRSISCAATLPLTNLGPVSSREYDFCDIPRILAASVWLNRRSRRQDRRLA